VSTHRKRQRRQRVIEPRDDPTQLKVEMLAEELLVLWQAMPSALAADSAGVLTGDRHAKGAVEGSPSPANTTVIDSAARIETGLYQVAAEAVRILNEDRAKQRTPYSIIAALPEWHRALAAKAQPLAKHIVRDLEGWMRDARGAIGTRRPDRELGPMCPEHRDTKPAPLLEVGAVATLARSLLDGPPPMRFLIGPVCPRGLYAECGHESCGVIRTCRVVLERGRISDWVYSPSEGGLVWLAYDGSTAWTWEKTRTVRCPKCRKEWRSTSELRMLARELAALGESRAVVQGLIS
jgi:hypothetical protein